MIRRIVITLLLLTGGLCFATPDPVTLGADSTRINLSHHVSWLKDAGGTLTLDDVRRRGNFTPPGQGVERGLYVGGHLAAR